MSAQQSLNALPQCRVIAACLNQVGGLLVRRQLNGGIKDLAW